LSVPARALAGLRSYRGDVRLDAKLTAEVGDVAPKAELIEDARVLGLTALRPALQHREPALALLPYGGPPAARTSASTPPAMISSRRFFGSSAM
jgi:hypothetical protein